MPRSVSSIPGLPLAGDSPQAGATMKALILIGLQNDLLAGGPLAVAGGEALLPIANQLQGAFRIVLATQQWHPANHRSFALNHRGRVAGEVIRVARLAQVLKPVHCVQNTRGAELSPGLMLTRVNKVIRLGQDADFDDVSAFFDAGDTHSTGLSDYLAEKRVKSVYLMGAATELAVQATALDAIGLGLKTWLIADACRAASADPEVAHRALATMQEAGVKLTQSGEIGLPRERRPGATPGPTPLPNT